VKKIILVAGATGNLGGRIVRELLAKGADVRALVRSGTDKNKIDVLEGLGAKVLYADLTSLPELTEACKEVTCVVSALQGLRDVIVETQSLLLEAAVATGVPRFIPSDFSTDFTELAPGENRNFDIRREFTERLDKAGISATSVFNGAFAEILSYGTPLFDLKKHSVGYWEDAEHLIDFTTMDDTAAFTAAAALDDDTPRALHIASFRISPEELSKTAGKVKNTNFQLVRMGSLEELTSFNKSERAAHPEGENELYPRWQSSQYVQSMFSVRPYALDNERYADVQWSSAEHFLESM